MRYTAVAEQRCSFGFGHNLSKRKKWLRPVTDGLYITSRPKCDGPSLLSTARENVVLPPPPPPPTPYLRTKEGI